MADRKTKKAAHGRRATFKDILLGSETKHSGAALSAQCPSLAEVLPTDALTEALALAGNARILAQGGLLERGDTRLQQLALAHHYNRRSYRLGVLAGCS